MYEIMMFAITVLLLVNAKGGGAKSAAKSGGGSKKAKASSKKTSSNHSSKKQSNGKNKSSNAEYKTGSKSGNENYSSSKQQAKAKDKKPSALEKKVAGAKGSSSKYPNYKGKEKVYTKKKNGKVYNIIKGKDGVIYIDFRSDEDRKAGKHIDDIVGDGASDEKKVDKEYEKIDKRLGDLRKGVPEISQTESLKNAPKNLKNIVVNAFDYSIGEFIADSQNNYTREYLKKNQGTKKKIVYLARGVSQTKGNGWRLAKSLKKQGYLVYHLDQDHNLSREENAKNNYSQILKLHKETGLKDPSSRDDLADGHSSGADILIYMSSQSKFSKTGIKNIQAVAPVPYGMKKAETFGQKILLPLVAKHDDASTIEGKLNAIDMAKRKPIPGVNVYVVAGKGDRLATPKLAVYEHAKEHRMIDHAHSTHFGTSGGNKIINEKYLIPHLKYMEQNSAGDVPKLVDISHKKIHGKKMQELYKKAA